MPQIVKPSRWAIQQDLIDPGWQNLWLRIQQSGGGIWPFWEHSGDKIYNAIQDSPAGDFTFLNAGHTWKGDTRGIGVNFDGTVNSEHTLAIIAPNPGFWTDGFSQHCALFVVTLDADISGTKVLYDLGGKANGFAVGYRQSSGAFIFSVGADSVTIEIQTTKTYVAHSTVVIFSQLNTADTGREMIFNVEGETITGSHALVGFHTSSPGVGAANTTADFHNAFGESDPDEWPGTIMFMWNGHFALSEAEIRKVVVDPFGIITAATTTTTHPKHLDRKFIGKNIGRGLG